MGGNLLANVGEAVAMLLFGIGFANLLFQKNLIKKIIGFDIMDTAIYLFLAEKGYIAGRMPPIVVNGIQDVEAYINPIPSQRAIFMSFRNFVANINYKRKIYEYPHHRSHIRHRKSPL